MASPGKLDEVDGSYRHWVWGCYVSMNECVLVGG
jgi:hypothetical protein